MTRLAVRPPATLAQVQRWLHDQGWRQQSHHAADTAQGDETVWTHAAVPAAVHCVDDRFVGQAWLAVVVDAGEAADPGAVTLAARLATRMAAELPLLDLQGALALPRAGPDAAAQALAARALAVLAPRTYDEVVMHALADLLQQGEAPVRHQALRALAALGWIELRPLVTALAVADPDPGLRAEAARTMQAFEQVHGRGADPA